MSIIGGRSIPIDTSYAGMLEEKEKKEREKKKKRRKKCTPTPTHCD